LPGRKISEGERGIAISIHFAVGIDEIGFASRIGQRLNRPQTPIYSLPAHAQGLLEANPPAHTPCSAGNGGGGPT
jgi:hypothetical protein